MSMETGTEIMPQAIGLVITKADKVNVCPINWQIVSTKYEKPLTVCIGLSNNSETLRTILEKKEFVFAYPDKSQLTDTLYCGTVSGKNIDKLENTNFIFDTSSKVAAPCLNNAVVNYECKLKETLEMNNYKILIGTILERHISDESFEKIYSFGNQTYGTITNKILQKER